jgi:hypothetical protein
MNADSTSSTRVSGTFFRNFRHLAPVPKHEQTLTASFFLDFLSNECANKNSLFI